MRFDLRFIMRFFRLLKTANPLFHAPMVCLLLIGGLPISVLAAWNHFDPADASKVPKMFSQTGFYANWQAKTVTSEAAAFGVNTPLWSDNASKSRWILLKGGPGKVTFNPDEDYFEYPDGAVFVKLFRHDTVPGNPASRIYWETRVLVNKKAVDTINSRTYDKWFPFSYRWKPDGSEAELVSEAGFDTSLTLWVNGQKTFRKWNFPSVGSCNACHRQYTGGFQGRAVLGFFTPQINRPGTADAKVNQISELFRKNILTWSKPAPTEAELAKLAQWADVGDESATLDLRARAYIAANCSGCHGARGKGTEAYGHATEMNFDHFRMNGGALLPEMEMRDKFVRVFEEMQPITIGGKVIEQALVVPGHPELSTLLFRMQNRNRSKPDADTAFVSTANQMPPLGVFEEDTAATRMIARWITGLPSLAIARQGRLPRAGGEVFVRGEFLFVPAADGVAVGLTGLDGRRHTLTGLPGGRYLLPKGLPSGLYGVQAGAKSFKLVF